MCAGDDYMFAGSIAKPGVTMLPRPPMDSGQVISKTQLIDRSKPEKFHEVECMFFERNKTCVAKKPAGVWLMNAHLCEIFWLTNHPALRCQ